MGHKAELTKMVKAATDFADKHGICFIAICPKDETSLFFGSVGDDKQTYGLIACEIAAVADKLSIRPSLIAEYIYNDVLNTEKKIDAKRRKANF